MYINKKYDIIIAGAGLSGLSLSWYLIQGGYQGKILLADSSFAPVNDKTWCFWSNRPPPFTQLIYKTWNQADIKVLDFQETRNLKEYSYHCIQSGDFKETLLTHIKRFPNITLLEKSILDFSSNAKKAVMVTQDGDSYISDQIIQNIFIPKKLTEDQIQYPLIQHFKGIEVETSAELFNPKTFTLMNVDEHYDRGLAFMYILPWSSNRALLEYTIFSRKPEGKDFYTDKIVEYLQNKLKLNSGDYSLGREEYGEIPMQIRPYYPYYGDNKIINLGTVGGLTKPSTGYTFMRIQQYCMQLAEALIKNEPTLPPPTRSRFRYRYYDRLLLHILSNSTQNSRKVFRDLFKNNSIDDVLRFLSEDTSFKQDLNIMSSVPYLPFFKAILHNLR